MSGAPIVVQTEHLSPEAAAWLARRCSVRRCAPDDPQFPSALAEARGLVVRTYTRVDERLLAGAPRLRVVGRAGAGLDNIDMAACRARRIQVVYTPDANTQAVVEYVVSLMSSAVRPPEAIDGPADPTRWAQLRARHAPRPQMSELTLGILGMGRIGRRLASVARAIGFKHVLYNDLLPIHVRLRHGARPVSAQELFAASDVITIHVDGRQDNYRFVGGRLIGLMRPRVIVINTSRGFIVDNLSLATFLKARPEALALLDVHEPEPIGPDYPLLGLPNARLYPHMGASTRLADLNMSWVVRDVVAVLEGLPPQHPAP